MPRIASPSSSAISAVPAPPKPALLAVDDESAVARAVERDLRRGFGERFRVLRAESGPAALEVVRALKARGEELALLLVDQRMPGMSGVEFLEQALDVFPQARRVLLTAYADTDAAISAINDVGLDFYLLKPWDPPEETLYPVVSGLLEDWTANFAPRQVGLRVVGQRWSRESHEIADILARNGVPYRWLDVEQPEAQQLLSATGTDGDVLPVVVFEDGDALQGPSVRDVAEHVGISARPAQQFYDLIIVGGGPAGLAAAVYGASEGLRTALIEREAPGGQAGQSSRIENYLGFPAGLSGADLARRARDQAQRFGAELLTVQEADGLLVNASARGVHLTSGSELAARAVIIATGVSYRRLDAPGVEDLIGRGVAYGAALTEAASCRDEDVFVVGAANSAGQAALNLALSARSVTLLVRGASLEVSMSRYLIDRIEKTANIDVRARTEIIAAIGDGHLERLKLRDAGGTVEDVPAEHVFVFIGAEPRTAWLGDAVARDERGFVLAGPDLPRTGVRVTRWPLARDPYVLETSVPGVFVAGDVRASSTKRVASAVGEGAMAVQLVHRYLGGEAGP